MTKDTDARLPLRFSSETHLTLKYLSRATGDSMNDIVVRAVEAELDRLKADPEVMSQVRDIIEEERKVQQGLTGNGETKSKPKRKKKAKARTVDLG